MINNIAKFIDDCEQNLSQKFKEVNEIALFNQKKVLEAFRKNNISQRHFIPTTGYGYDDEGRLALSKIFSEIFHTENAIVSPLIASGTAALSAALFGILRPEDYLYSISGKPYDTLSEVISGTSNGSLKDFKINYLETDIKIENENIDFDYKEIEKNLKKHFIKLVFIGRSRGYEWREAVSLKLIENAVKFIKSISPETIIMVDNCYGEFVETKEPSDCGVDLIVGSLNKNPGGGLAPTGGYIAGKVGDTVEIVGIKDTRSAVITGVEMFRKLLDQAEAGDNIGVLLRGIAREEVVRGQVLAKPKTVTPHSEFKAQVYVLTKEEGGRHTAFFSNYRPQFYFRTTDVTGVIELPEGTEMVMPGDNTQMTVKLIHPIAVEQGTKFSIREGGRTVGAGSVSELEN